MNFYIENAKLVLSEIEGFLDYDTHIKRLECTVREKASDVDRVVVCGGTELGKKSLDFFEKITKKKVELWDLRGNDSNTRLPSKYEKEFENVLYVICSREEAFRYLKMIPTKDNMKIMSYNELFLLDKCFSDYSTLSKNRQYVTGRIGDIFDNLDIYLKLFEMIDEEYSKELLAKLVLYRLFLDLRLCCDVKCNAEFYYFDPSIIRLSTKERFVDAGGYNGDTLEEFLSVSGGHYEHYYLFEPDGDLLDTARAKSDDVRISYIQKGLYSSDATMFFSDPKDRSQGMVCNEGRTKIEVVKLDDMQDIYPTFIKMDIEGSETDALDGADGWIKKCKPKLAICIYHKESDVSEIARKIIDYGYKELFLRCGKNSFDDDVVIYAR